ncbi:Coiled-coil domain-containing protein 96, partial [Borealophlyctis nickersoniae]
GENVDLKHTLRTLDTHVSSRRDTLPLQKQVRDALRQSNLQLRQRNGLLGNKPLLRDFEEKVDDATGLSQRIDTLRAHHAQLSAETLATKRKIQKAQIVAGTI